MRKNLTAAEVATAEIGTQVMDKYGYRWVRLRTEGDDEWMGAHLEFITTKELTKRGPREYHEPLNSSVPAA